MTRIHILYISCYLLLLSSGQVKAIDTLKLDMRTAIQIAQKQSPDVLVARHSFRSSYWNYCYYKANYKPTLVFSSTPYYNNQINIITMEDGTSNYIRQKQVKTDANLSITQNIPWTGGAISVNTSLQRLDNIGDFKQHTYKANPVSVSIQQSLFGYNALKWDRQIEPLRFEESKRLYVETLELVAVNTINKFFNLGRAQSNLEIAKINFANADTLYIFAKGRYNIGTITENEMLQLEINKLTEESNVSNAQLEVDDYMEDLRTYLGLTDEVLINAEFTHQIPDIKIELSDALSKAIHNSSDMVSMQRRKKESDSQVAYARSQTGLKADIYAQLGLTQTGKDISHTYKDLQSNQYIEIGIRVPILDWGRGKEG